MKFNCLKCPLYTQVSFKTGKCIANNTTVNAKISCEEGKILWEQQMSKDTLEKEKMGPQ